MTKLLQQDPRTVPIPSSPNSSTDDNTKADGNFPPIKDTTIKPDRLTTSKPSSKNSSDELSSVERELIAAINAINSSKSLVSQSKKELTTIPSLHTKSNITSSEEQLEIFSDTTTDSDVIMSEENEEKFHANKNPNIMIEEVSDYVKNTNENSPAATPFTAVFPKVFPPNYSSSRANHYIKPNSKEMDATDSSLLQENERRVSLCLDPFSREFYKATGHSKLQLPDDYLELVRVIVYENPFSKRIRKIFIRGDVTRF